MKWRWSQKWFWQVTTTSHNLVTYFLTQFVTALWRARIKVAALHTILFYSILLKTLRPNTLWGTTGVSLSVSHWLWHFYTFAAISFSLLVIGLIEHVVIAILAKLWFYSMDAMDFVLDDIAPKTGHIGSPLEDPENAWSGLALPVWVMIRHPVLLQDRTSFESFFLSRFFLAIG